MTLEDLQKKAHATILALEGRLRPKATKTPWGGTIDPPAPFVAHRFVVDASARSGHNGEGGELVLIAPGATFEVVRQCWHRAKVLDLDIAPSLARYFDILSLKVGRDEQIAYDNVPMPALSYTEKWKKGRLMGCHSTLPSQLSATLKIKNVGKRPHHFKAVYTCETVEDTCR